MGKEAVKPRGWTATAWPCTGSCFSCISGGAAAAQGGTKPGGSQTLGPSPLESPKSLPGNRTGSKGWLSRVSVGRIPPGGAVTEPSSRAAAALCPVSPLPAVGSHLCCAGRGAVLPSAAQYLGFSIQFKKSPPKIPYKAIALAVVLFMIGTFLIIIGALLLAGYISKGVSASWHFCHCSCPVLRAALNPHWSPGDRKQPQVAPGWGLHSK